jgi:hypothetical protein
MPNRQVPRAEWPRFFREFSLRHDGWLVTIRVLHEKLGSQIEARDLPLEGIVPPADSRGPISIHLGATVERNVEHEIAAPTQVWVEISERGAEEALEILSEDGTKTILEFRVAAVPDEVDGILHP